MSMLTTNERVTIACLSVTKLVARAGAVRALALCARWRCVRAGAVRALRHLVRISGCIGEQGASDAGEVVAELQAAGALVAVAAHLQHVTSRV
jgi:hypothetical protein